MAFGDEGTGGDERSRRRDALRALAEGTAQPGRPAPVEPRPPAIGDALIRRSRWPNWVTPAVSVVVALALIALVVAHFLPSKARPTAPAYYAIDAASLGIACLVGEAWSPDGSQVAVIGTQRSCAVEGDGAPVFPNVVVIINAAAGKSASQILPDASAQLAIKQAGAPSPQPIVYSGIAWSPDGKGLALPFTVQYTIKAGNGSEGNPDAIGVLVGLNVVSVSGGQGRAYLVSNTDSVRFTGEWNLKTGKPVLLDAPLSNQVVTIGMGQLSPAALRYTWRADGTLAASDLLTTTSAPNAEPGAVGVPDGGASFTVWQPMFISQNTGDPIHPVSPAPFAAFTTILAWSPDGTYLFNAGLGPWRIQPSKQPIPGPAQLKAAFMDKAPLLPLRDAALDTALNNLTDKVNTITSNGGVAWSPDGRMLSAYRQGVDGATVLTVLDCATGKSLATITLKGSSTVSAMVASGGMRWSPDGKRLLVQADGELFIIGPGALPQR